MRIRAARAPATTRPGGRPRGLFDGRGNTRAGRPTTRYPARR